MTAEGWLMSVHVAQLLATLLSFPSVLVQERLSRLLYSGRQEPKIDN